MEWFGVFRVPELVVPTLIPLIEDKHDYQRHQNCSTDK